MEGGGKEVKGKRRAGGEGRRERGGEYELPLRRTSGLHALRANGCMAASVVLLCWRGSLSGVGRAAVTLV